MSYYTELSEHAVDHIRHLAGTIGARPAGSEGERQAFDYVAQKMETLGYRLRWSDVPYAAPMPFFPLNALAAMLLAILCWFTPGLPWLGFLAPFALFALPQASRWLVRSRKRTATSRNLLALRGEKEMPEILFCAHIDSPHASFFTGSFLLSFFSRMLFYAQRVALGALVLGVLHLAGFPVPLVLDHILMLAGAIVGATWLLLDCIHQLGRPHRLSPGAVDNASGVGAVMALAEHFALQMGEADAGFLFTGAEETGLHGARAFAEALPSGASLHVINLDMVGAGDELYYVTSDGTLPPLKTDHYLNQLIQRADSGAKGLWYTVKSGDFAEFLRKGIPAASLQTGGSYRAELAYHTTLDTPSLIETEALERVIRTCVLLVRMFDRKAGSASDSN
jgi:hypothetical protein